ncbi:Uncharacterized protein dnm_054990 [Desulfonema magnum]|uniref:Uncharacterized protein n=1 Tax=Desulfonema magnum TaxID=45655 RepID=A0A975GQ23_9BACT|nr:Uncharacterized protein dnm_054990 [Desulfonema magnum]
MLVFQTLVRENMYSFPCNLLGFLKYRSFPRGRKLSFPSSGFVRYVRMERQGWE